MNNPIKEEYTREMDSLRFSDQAKEAMIRSLVEQSVHQKKGNRNAMKKAVYIILAAVLLVATMTGAAVYTRWSRSLPQAQNTTQTQREQAEKTGLSSRPEKQAPKGDVTSATANGITVTLVQTLVDQSEADLVFKISGYHNYPQDQQPMMMPELDFEKQISMGAFGNVSCRPVDYVDGVWQFEDGSPVPLDEAGDPIFQYADENGDLEFLLTIQSDELSQLFGTPIKLTFRDMGISEKAHYTPLVQGPWELSWTLEGSQEAETIPVEKPIGDTGIILKEVTISPLNLTVLLQLKEEFTGFDTLEPFQPALVGVRTRDGVLHKDFNGGGSENYVDREKNLFSLRRSFDGILEIDQIDAILFVGWDSEAKEEILYTVPLP